MFFFFHLNIPSRRNSEAKATKFAVIYAIVLEYLRSLVNFVSACLRWITMIHMYLCSASQKVISQFYTIDFEICFFNFLARSTLRAAYVFVWLWNWIFFLQIFARWPLHLCLHAIVYDCAAIAQPYSIHRYDSLSSVAFYNARFYVTKMCWIELQLWNWLFSIWWVLRRYRSNNW